MSDRPDENAGPVPEAPDEIWDTIEVDGYLVNSATGEVVGLVDDTFHVDDEKSAEWVLEKMQQEDAQVAGLTARLNAIKENIETLRNRHANRRTYLETKFGAELAEFAKTQLDGKIKSWTCPFGTVAFRSTPERLAVADEDKALEWAKVHEPQAVKTTEKFLISRLGKDTQKAILEAGTASLHGLRIEPAGESVTIKTGVEK